MKKIGIVLLFAFLFVNLSQGQQTSEYGKTLKKMFEISGTEATFKSVVTQVIGMYREQMKNVDKAIWDEFETEMLKTSLDELADMLAPVYEKYLTVEDLNAIISFYKTPAGEKYAKNTPLITQESMQIGQQWGMKLGEKVSKLLKEKGY